MQVDVNDEGVSVKERPFPSEIAVVSGPGTRLDGVVQTKTVMWIELTNPWEENLAKKHFEEMDLHNQLAIDLREGKHPGVKWTVVSVCGKVGAKGAGQDAAPACSYYIFLRRFLRTWEPQALVDTVERSECRGYE